MFAAIRDRTSPHRKEGFMGREGTIDGAPREHAELWGGLERDLGRLQGLLDSAVERLNAAFERIGEAAAALPAGNEINVRISEDARRVVTCLQFHDIASQLIGSMCNRAALLEMAALVVAPGAVADEHARLLTQALQLTHQPPGGARIDVGGEVDLF